MLKEECKNLLEEISSEDELSDEEAELVFQHLWTLSTEEWRQAFVNFVTNPKTYVQAVARISKFLKQKIEEYEEEEEEKKEGIIDLTFLAHGNVQSPLLPCTLHYLNDRVQSIKLYVPWGCCLHNSAAYGIITGNISINTVRYTTDLAHLPTFSSEWNTLPADWTQIPEVVFNQVETSENVYKLLMYLFAQLRGNTRGLVIPYFNPPGVPSLPEIPLWALTNVVAVVGWILNKRFRIHIAACLFPREESILTREIYPWPTVNCKQYCVVPIQPKDPVTMLIPGFRVPDYLQPAFGVLDTLLGTKK